MVNLSFENVSRSELRTRARTLMNDALGILTMLGDEAPAAAKLQSAIDHVSKLADDLPSSSGRSDDPATAFGVSVIR